MRLLFLTVFSFVTMLFGTCESNEYEHTYEVGEAFEVSLEKDGMGGYLWEYVPIPEFVLLDSSETKKKVDNNLTEYTKLYKLKGITKGIFELRFHKKRSFDREATITKENLKILTVKIN